MEQDQQMFTVRPEFQGAAGKKVCTRSLIITANLQKKHCMARYTWSGGYKTYFGLNSTEHKIYPAHKC